MNTLQRFLLAAAATAVSTPVLAATNLSGSYLVTLTGTRPASVNGQTLCITLVEDGSVLGFPNSGTVTFKASVTDEGQFFTKNHGFTAEIPLGDNSFLSFSGVLGQAHIQGTSFVEVIQGKFYAAGNFTAVRNGCGPSN